MPKKDERQAFTSRRGPIEVTLPAQTTPPVTREVDLNPGSSTDNQPRPAATKKKGS